MRFAIARMPARTNATPEKEAILVPAWRFGFALEDPRDCHELTSLAAVRARCGVHARSG